MMILRHFNRLVVVSIFIILLSSCLGGKNEGDAPINKDTQIYSFSIDWKEGKKINRTNFDINQVDPLIYNRDSLPVGTKIDKCVLNIAPGAEVEIKLKLKSPNEEKLWEAKDSVKIDRLVKIEVTSVAVKTKKVYDFDLRVHNQDPDSLIWTKLTSEYMKEASVSDKKSIIIGENIVSYFKVNGELKAISAKANKGNTWKNESLSGLPSTVILSSLVNTINANETGVLAITTDGKLFKSAEGINWNESPTAKSMKTIVGDILFENTPHYVVMLEEDGKKKICVTADFKIFRGTTNIPDNFPTDNYSSISFNNKENKLQKYIVLSSSSLSAGKSTMTTWLIKEDVKENVRKLAITKKENIDKYNNPTLFHYNNTLYMICVDGEKKTRLFTSKDYGWNWTKPIDKHNLPKKFIASKNQGVVVDKGERTVWILGGEEISTGKPVGDVWRGRINRK